MNQVAKNTEDIKILRKDVNNNKSRIDNIEHKTLVSLETINKKLNRIHGGAWSIFQNIMVGGAIVLLLIIVFS